MTGIRIEAEACTKPLGLKLKGNDLHFIGGPVSRAAPITVVYEDGNWIRTADHYAAVLRHLGYRNVKVRQENKTMLRVERTSHD